MASFANLTLLLIDTASQIALKNIGVTTAKCVAFYLDYW